VSRQALRGGVGSDRVVVGALDDQSKVTLGAFAALKSSQVSRVSTDSSDSRLLMLVGRSKNGDPDPLPQIAPQEIWMKRCPVLSPGFVEAAI